MPVVARKAATCRAGKEAMTSNSACAFPGTVGPASNPDTTAGLVQASRCVLVAP